MFCSVLCHSETFDNESVLFSLDCEFEEDSFQLIHMLDRIRDDMNVEKELLNEEGIRVIMKIWI